MAEDKARPLLERIRFLAIVSDSLDDFFQVRVAGLHEQVTAPVSMTSLDGMTPEAQLDGIGERVRDLIAIGLLPSGPAGGAHDRAQAA
jgi:polyphosphate kinase